MKITKVFSFVLVCFFAIIFVLIHFIRSDLYFLKYPLSRYCIGDYGILMSVGFLCFGTSEILFGYNIYKRIHKLNRVSILAVIAGLGVFIAAFFTMNVDQKPSLTGNLHFFGASLQFLLFPIFSLYTYKDYLIEKLKKIFFVASLLTFFFFFLIILSICIKNDFFFTISEKMDICFFTIWLIIIEFKMLNK